MGQPPSFYDQLLLESRGKTRAPKTLQPWQTSREIAELTDKEISHVHRDIRAMLEQLKGHDPEVDDVREDKDQRGYTVCFHLTKGLTITLVASCSVAMRHRIVTRWQQLEAGAAPVLNMRDPRQIAIAQSSALPAEDRETLKPDLIAGWRYALSRYSMEKINMDDHKRGQVPPKPMPSRPSPSPGPAPRF